MLSYEQRAAHKHCENRGRFAAQSWEVYFLARLIAGNRQWGALSVKMLSLRPETPVLQEFGMKVSQTGALPSKSKEVSLCDGASMWTKVQ